jgi:hypothetical protein
VSRQDFRTVLGISGVVVLAIIVVGVVAEVSDSAGESAAPMPTVGGYERALFPHWSDLDGDGCDTRSEVLARDAIQSTVGPDGCVRYVVILDPYTGERVAGRAEIDIDHLISLRDAWDSGAHAWTTARRAGAWCSYAGTYRAVKTAYGLVVTPAQDVALRELASSCGDVPPMSVNRGRAGASR